MAKQKMRLPPGGTKKPNMADDPDYRKKQNNKAIEKDIDKFLKGKKKKGK